MTKAGMQMRPVRTEQDHTAAVARIENLMSAAPDTPEGDELDVLATLVDAYETKHYVMDAPDPVAAIQFRMEQQHLSHKDLEPLIGSHARVSEVLTGEILQLSPTSSTDHAAIYVGVATIIAFLVGTLFASLIALKV